MSDRKENPLWELEYEGPTWREAGEEWTNFAHPPRAREASPADLLAAVRRGVESGTIKGEVVEWCEVHGAPVTHNDQGPNPDCVRHEWDPHLRDIPDLPTCRVVSALVIPDGGSET